MKVSVVRLNSTRFAPFSLSRSCSAADVDPSTTDNLSYCAEVALLACQLLLNGKHVDNDSLKTPVTKP